MHVRKAVESVRSSLWFVPGVIVLASIGLAFALVEAEWSGLAKELRQIAPRFFSMSPDDARQLLATIATSVLTVAGVTFSVTAVTLSLVASQYTPRVVRTFMRSAKTQLALGVLLGVYAYSLVVLRTVSGGESPYVPDIAVNFANLYALVGLFVFILFVHHIASFIQPVTIAADLFSETLDSICAFYPEEQAEEPPNAGSEVEESLAELPWHALPSPRAGYIEQVDFDALVEYASRAGTVVRIAPRLGEFVLEGTSLLHVANAPPNKAEGRRLLAAVSLGSHRTIEQDPAFGVRQLVDMALKGLSPAINDPTTAMLCIDHLSALLRVLSRRRISATHRGADGALRAIVPRAGFEEILGNAIEPLSLGAREHPQVQERLLRMLAELTRGLPRGSRRRAAWAEVAAVADQVARMSPMPGRAHVMAVAARLRSELDAEEIQIDEGT